MGDQAAVSICTKCIIRVECTVGSPAKSVQDLYHKRRWIPGVTSRDEGLLSRGCSASLPFD